MKTKSIFIGTALLVSLLLLSACNLQAPPVEEPVKDEAAVEVSESAAAVAVVEPKAEVAAEVAPKVVVETPKIDAKVEVDTKVMSAALYQDFSSSKYLALKGKQPLVLFFHASWCPLCRVQDRNILDELSSFPAGSNILKTDYDKEVELKKAFKVTVQTTFVILDANGNVSATLLDPTTSALKAAIQKTLN